MSLQSFRRALVRCNQQITLQTRNLQAPTTTANYDEQFTDIGTIPAIVKTIRGRSYFDGVNTETNITHEIRIEWLSGISAQTWVLFKGRRFKILNHENCCEKDEILVLECTDRGFQEASKA